MLTKLSGRGPGEAQTFQSVLERLLSGVKNKFASVLIDLSFEPLAKLMGRTLILSSKPVSARARFLSGVSDSMNDDVPGFTRRSFFRLTSGKASTGSKSASTRCIFARNISFSWKILDLVLL